MQYCYEAPASAERGVFLQSPPTETFEEAWQLTFNVRFHG
jgi:hypothetical protein